MQFDRDVRTLNVEPNVTGDLQVVSLAYNPRTARFDVTFDLQSSAALRWQTTRFTGVAVETVEAITVEHPVEHGEVLKASDLVVERRPKADGPVITDMRMAIGLAARHQLRPGQPLHDADLTKPAVVQRNDTVTLIYEAPGLTLTLRGQAQDAGALGDTISVINSQSKRTVQGVVTGPGRVTVTPSPALLVDSHRGARPLQSNRKTNIASSKPE